MRRPGMVPCSVATHYGAWFVYFDNTSSLLLQTDYDQAAFAVSCGAIHAPKDWDGRPSSLGKVWEEFNPEDICWCPDDYLDFARKEGRL